MDAALEAAGRLFTQALNQAGRDCAGLALKGPVPPAVAGLLADCIVYPGQNGPEFLTLGLTRDFKGYTYPPHFRLFMIINAALLLEDLPQSPLRVEIALAQIPRALIDAHMMRIWIKYIRPTGLALVRQDKAGLESILRGLITENMALRRLAPDWIQQRFDMEQCSREWYAGGFPAAIGQPLTPDVKRINNLPMTEFVGKLITDFLAQTQMEGLRERFK
ncbi:hypothetical protein MJ8_01210 [Mesorhizobium sp. J8]|nr:hypothetical protein MJ8_01210 [Mesorhizobium sp. J8]